MDRHPDVEMARPLRPEPKYFIRNETLDLDAYIDAHFTHPDVTTRGEKSTSYFERPDALARIRDLLPEARAVVVVRDPVARAISHYRFSAANGLESRPVEAALRADLQGDEPSWDPGTVSVSPFAYVRRGHYVRYLDALLRVFPRERTHVAILEELLTTSQAVADIWEFICVRPLQADLATASLDNASTGQMPVIAPAFRAELLEHFEASTSALERFLGRELPWARAAA